MTSRRGRNSSLVYSTEVGAHCPTCSQRFDRCRCKSKGSAKPQGPPSDGIVRVSRQTKGRRGKGVTLVTGLSLADDELKKLAKRLKQLCGSGGTIRQGVIEIQGDHRDTLVRALSKDGRKVKKAGG